MYIDLFVYAVRTTSGNKIPKKKKTGADTDDLVCFFLKSTFWRAFFKKAQKAQKSLFLCLGRLIRAINY
jgi:hypothetical protein